MHEGKFFDGSFEIVAKNPRLAKLKKRKLFSVKNQIYYTIAKGEGFTDKVKILKFDLTMEDIL